MEQVAEFVSGINDLFGGFKERAEQVSDALRSPEVAFVLVTSPDPLAIGEARFFSEKLQDAGMKREAIIVNARVPIGTVPIYSMIIGRSIEELSLEVILETLRHQARQGVDYFTIHAGVAREHLPFIRKRLIGIVSRGGSLLAKWMLHHGEENPMYTHFEAICDLMREYDVSFSLGDGLRPGGLADATDRAQLAELQTIGERSQ